MKWLYAAPIAEFLLNGSSIGVDCTKHAVIGAAIFQRFTHWGKEGENRPRRCIEDDE